MEFQEFEDFSDLEGLNALDELDLASDPLEKIQPPIVKRMQDILRDMKEEFRLCDEVSEGAAIEFGFKGNKEAVEKQLEHLIKNRIEIPFQEQDRKTVVEESNRFCNHVQADMKLRKPHMSLWRQLMEEKWQGLENEGGHQERHEKLIAASKNKANNRWARHERRECLCYNNS